RTDACSWRPAHRSAHTSLLFGCELENILHQQLSMILFVSLERRGSRAGEYPPAVFVSEQPGGHGGARADGLRVDNPTLHPIGLQASLGLQEVRRSCGSIMSGITRGVTFQAGRRV